MQKVFKAFKVYVKHFYDVTADCMKDCVKPALKNPPDHFILCVGTNDLIPNQTSEEITISFINLASQHLNISIKLDYI